MCNSLSKETALPALELVDRGDRFSFYETSSLSSGGRAEAAATPRHSFVPYIAVQRDTRTPTSSRIETCKRRLIETSIAIMPSHEMDVSRTLEELDKAMGAWFPTG